MKTPKNPKSFRFPEDIDQKLREESERTNIPQTGIIIAALKKWFGYKEITYTIMLPNGTTIATVVADGATDSRELA
ncbi:MAG: ribbon-helix-helix domain-containing protein [Nostoc sp.]|uniref:ribbon-helix-helix domain-containing protein n=1 Tax=Nostoc sp. TaxID=1180 RepID=UPI002FFCD4CA